MDPVGASRTTQVVVVVGTRGQGSNMLALGRAMSDPEFPAELLAVVASNHDAPAIQKARSLGYPVRIADPDPAHLGASLEGADLVCLAGYMRKVPLDLVTQFRGRMLNIHPSLLPKYGGQGMYGRKVHEAVLSAKESESGCTVHLVTEEYDDGATLLQDRCPVLPDDTPETLAARVQQLEHRIYPQAVREWCHRHG